MDVIDIFPEGWHVKLRFSEKQVDMLLDYLDHCEASLDLSDPKNLECHKYITEEFFPKLETISKAMKEAPNES